MRKIGATFVGLLVWYLGFLLFQFLGYKALEGLLSSLSIDAALGVLTSLGSIALAQYAMRRILPSFSMRQIAVCLGAAVASSFAVLLVIKGLPVDYGPLVSCLVGALVAFAVPFAYRMPNYSLKRTNQSLRD